MQLEGATAKLITKENLPHFHSIRDTRDQLDLITDHVLVGARTVKADQIVYHPGDTATKHYHTGCHHLFYGLYGRSILHMDMGSHRLAPGMVTVVTPSELHWFENDTQENFSFVEFWGPPPKEAAWLTDDL